MEQPEVLLAKKPNDPKHPRREETLVGHTEAVMDAAQYFGDLLAPHLVAATQCSCEAAKYWRKALSIAAWLHDIGKANSHFQEMLRTRDISFRQGVRHEAVSLVIAAIELDDWLENLWKEIPRWAKAGVLFAISGHHVKFPDTIERSGTGTDFTAFTGLADFGQLLNLGAEAFRLPAPPGIENRDYSLLALDDANGRPVFARLLRNIQRELDCDFTQSEKVLIGALKAALMDADLAGSALPRRGIGAESWLRERLSTSMTRGQLYDVVSKKLDSRKPWAFQNEVAEAGERTVLLEAACGSGKTAAAYLWASRNAEGKRLFFCYPTTVTASEGFAGYLRDPDFEAILINYRADVDYDLMDNMPPRSKTQLALRSMRLEALETWAIPAVVCTAHTVLGLMENYRRGIYAFPSILRSAFVFDEIHALSDKVFGYLCRFLQTFPGAPVLLMTATLPPARIEALKSACRMRGEIRRIYGPPEREKAKRYRPSIREIVDAWDQVCEALERREKVLWICNTVRRAIETFDEALKRGYPVEAFHSRYRYEDRLKRQRAVIDGFAPGKPGMLAVTTQVAEVSLDISADLLISDAAPIPAMIQRLGRVNRTDDEPSKVAPAIFMRTESKLPYNDEQWRGVDEWLELVCDDKPKSQSDLSRAFLATASKYSFAIKRQAISGWLDGLWKTRCDRSIQEASRTIQVVREEDFTRGQLERQSIPMNIPRGNEWLQWRREGLYFISPRGKIIYDELRGAEWKTE